MVYESIDHGNDVTCHAVLVVLLLRKPKINVMVKKIDQAIDHSFYGFTGVITHTGCWENMRKASKSLAFGS